MPDGISHAQERLGGYDRSPLTMPPTEARVLMQMAAIRLHQMAAEQGRLECAALADALEEAAAGNTEAACQALNEADTYRRMRA